ncbi:GNAT family N-acetyltransferase [Corallococcus llansteffanensis]|uniref:GNAT family N-acetyltransferase n=1 Tax=Corallococcus llansteffanensis TaxID=2316731 RepID=A0A3A8QQH0_9BACT|nr:GNAT family N-acetyltransferase [Corallococcus llansteffanensis]RKH67112.1 GNAT family N-acetyltransferase [Corallococcus llansteffanensis]
MRLDVERVDTVEKLHALGPGWRALAASAGQGLPFATWEWNVTWWRHFQEQRHSVRDHLFVLALRDRDGTLRAVAPLMRTERPGSGPVRARVLQFLGADPNVTELRGLLCAPEWEASAWAAVTRHLREHASEWDWILWSGLALDGPAPGELSRLAPLTPLREVPAYVLPLAPTWEAFKASRSRNIKESLRKCYNSLKRDGHAFTFAVARAPEDIPPALEAFFRLHQARATATDAGVSHRDVFASSQARGFLQALCGELARQDAVRVFQLCIGGAVVAARVGFVLGGALYLYYSGYEPRWGDYSVMTTTVAEALQYAIAQGLSVAHLSSGRDVSKLRWGPREIQSHDALQLSPEWRGRAAFATYRKVRELLSNEQLQGWARRTLARRAGE